VKKQKHEHEHHEHIDKQRHQSESQTPGDEAYAAEPALQNIDLKASLEKGY